jgi:CheY-specific phosphatase CheX
VSYKNIITAQIANTFTMAAFIDMSNPAYVHQGREKTKKSYNKIIQLVHNFLYSLLTGWSNMSGYG